MHPLHDSRMVIVAALNRDDRFIVLSKIELTEQINDLTFQDKVDYCRSLRGTESGPSLIS